MHIDHIIYNVHPLPGESAERLKSHITEVNYPKGHILMHANKVETKIYLIKQGIVRAFSDTENHQITFWFGKEGDTIISMKSYIYKEKGYESIELLEDCTFYELEASAIQQLFEQDIQIANWGRKFAEQELMRVEERLISRQFRTAIERYNELIKNYPHLIHRVQLGHIASYLGITQASLSRIRAKSG